VNVELGPRDEGAETFGHLGCLRLLSAFVGCDQEQAFNVLFLPRLKVLCAMESSRVFCNPGGADIRRRI
jgi:hypothetical protein